MRIDETTNPAGFFIKSTPTTSGSLFTSTTATKTYNSYQFVYWTLNGVRQTDATGRARNPVVFNPTTDTSLVAVYQLAAADTDSDGILDVYEQEFFGSLSENGNSDGDGDGFSLQLEILLGYHPGMRNVVSEGGVARRSSDTTTILINTSYYAVTAISEPPGIVGPVTQYLTGGTFATLPTPVTSLVGTNFIGWYDVNDTRVDSAATKQPAVVAVSAAATFKAKYVSATRDSDADGLLDWFELFSFSNLLSTSGSDPDADGLSILTEQILNYAAFIKNVISDGGISRRSSDLVDVNIAGYYTLQTFSNPIGLQAGSQAFGAPGSSLDTPNLITNGVNLNVNGYRFVGWDVEGARILDSTGAGAGKASLLLNTNRTATAQFVLDTIDSDADGVMDWLELFYYGGSLSGNTLTDADGDGYSYALEMLLGYHPRVFNLLKEGGVSRRSTDSVSPPYLIFNWKPTITSQPSSVTAVATNSFSLSVGVESYSTASYQWRKDGVNISGGTSATLTVASAKTTDTGLYDVVVTDIYGDATSTTAAVSIDGLPVVTISPVGQAAVNPSGSLTFSATALGTGPFTYQWRKDGAALSGGTGTTYTVLNAQASHAGVYEVVVSNSRASATSEQTVLSLNVPVSITSDPTGLVRVSGGSASFSVTATGTAPLTYQWRKDGADISGANAATFKLNPVATWDSGTYTVMVTNAVGSVSSGSATLTVYDPVLIGTQPVSLTKTVGQSAVLSVDATGSSPVTYQWRRNGVNISGATSASYTIANAGPGSAGSYDVVITNPAGSVTSSAAAFTVNEPVPSAVTFAQRTDGSKVVDIYYTLQGGTTSVALGVSLDGGTTFSSMASVSGHVGAAITAGTSKYIGWDAGIDFPNSGTQRARVRVTALLEGAGGTFAPIPAGTYSMGNLIGDTDIANAGTVSVTLGPYYMAVYDTTKAQWDTVRTWGLNNGYDDLAAGGGKAASHPVHSVSWYDAVKWANAASEKEGLIPCYTVGGAVVRTGTSSAVACDWSANGYRLPTEAEWEVAARGGLLGKRYPWGDAISQAQANYKAGGGYAYDLSGAVNDFHPDYSTGAAPYTSPVGSFAANGYGLYDMAGNVQQWCWDWYGAPYAGGSDPQGAATGSNRVLRGGYWSNAGASNTRSAFRGSSSPTATNNGNGFRLARGRPAGTSIGAQSAADVVDTASPVLTLPGDTTVEATSASGASVTFSGGGATDNIGTPTLSYSAESGGTFALGTTEVTATATDSMGNVTRGTFTVTVTASLSISVQPEGLTVLAGSSASMSVVARGTAPMRYQWRKGGINISGGTLENYTIPFAQVVDSGSYDVVISNPAGSVTSAAAKLLVKDLFSVEVLTGPFGSAFFKGSNAFQGAWIDRLGNEAPASWSYALLSSSGTGAAVASGTLGQNVQMNIPLRAITASGEYVVRVTRTVPNGSTVSINSSPFRISVRTWADAAGSYEVMLEDGNGAIGDRAQYRGKVTATLNSTGAVSGRLLYNAAPHLEAANPALSPDWSVRAYAPVVRALAGAFKTAADGEPQVVRILRQGTGADTSGQVLTLSVDFSSTPLQLKAVVQDYDSVPLSSSFLNGAVSSGSSSAVVTNLRTVALAGGTQVVDLSSAAAVRYALASDAMPSAVLGAGADNNAFLLVQALPTGNLLWATRLTGYSGSGSGVLRLLDVAGGTSLAASFYEAQSLSSGAVLQTTSLLGELQLNRDLASGAWTLGVRNGDIADGLERQSSYLGKGLVNGKLAPVYNAATFSAGNLPPSRVGTWSRVGLVEFGDQNAAAWSLSTGVFGAMPNLYRKELYLSALDPVTGGKYIWRVSISSVGVVRTWKHAPGDASQPVLGVTLDRARGEFLGGYTGLDGIRRNLRGVVLQREENRDASGQGWLETGVLPGMQTGGWWLSE